MKYVKVLTILILFALFSLGCGRGGGGDDGAFVPPGSTPPPVTQPPPPTNKISAFDGKGQAFFGFSVDIDGDYAIVGARSDDGQVGQASQAGAAYIFHRVTGNTWDGGIKIVAPDAEALDFFGHTVAISGDYAIVGAFGKDNGGTNRGAAYIFQRTGTNTWSTGVKIIAPDTEDLDEFGYAVDISGDFVIVGAHWEDEKGSQAGAAYIYQRTGPNTWGAGTKIMADDAEADDNFGISVAISGDYAVAGASLEGSGGFRPGAAYIFYRTGPGNVWDTGVKVVGVTRQDADRFGNEVAIDGDYAIVGAWGDDEGGSFFGQDGAAYIYHRTGPNPGDNIWDTGVKILAFDPDTTFGDNFGESVDISGDTAVVGALLEDDGGENAGSAYIFNRTGTNSWDGGTKIVAADSITQDNFGQSVATSQGRTIVGATGVDAQGSSSGAAYFFY